MAEYRKVVPYRIAVNFGAVPLTLSPKVLEIGEVPDTKTVRLVFDRPPELADYDLTAVMFNREKKLRLPMGKDNYIDLYASWVNLPHMSIVLRFTKDADVKKSEELELNFGEPEGKKEFSSHAEALAECAWYGERSVDGVTGETIVRNLQGREITRLPGSGEAKAYTDTKVAAEAGARTQAINNEAAARANADTAVKEYIPFTYIVDSDQKLADWANNVAGNDYTAVLIRPGTWTSSTEVNLTNTGTKVVVGIPGSKLSFTSQYGLRYSSAPTTKEYSMHGVTVECAPPSGYGYGFSNCTNLTNCTGSSSGTDYGYGFSSCTNLTNCTGTGSGTSYGYGFSNCTNLTNCTGTGTGTGTGYGFQSCRGMLLNKPGSASKTATYNSCYVSISGSGAAPDDSAAGGWNKVTA
jgi:hypothetical protein